MGIDVLHDPAKGRAALYCNTSELPLLIELFADSEGPDGFVGAEEMADKFLSDATEHFGGVDLRKIEPGILHAYQAEWFQANAPENQWSARHGA